MYAADIMYNCPHNQYVTIHVTYVMITLSIMMLCNPAKSIRKHQYKLKPIKSCIPLLRYLDFSCRSSNSDYSDMQLIKTLFAKSNRLLSSLILLINCLMFTAMSSVTSVMVQSAINKIKPGKSDGMLSDNLKKRTLKLNMYISVLFSARLIYWCCARWHIIINISTNTQQDAREAMRVVFFCTYKTYLDA